jgi:hypothetical protein
VDARRRSHSSPQGLELASEAKLVSIPQTEVGLDDLSPDVRSHGTGRTGPAFVGYEFVFENDWKHGKMIWLHHITLVTRHVTALFDPVFCIDRSFIPVLWILWTWIILFNCFKFSFHRLGASPSSRSSYQLQVKLGGSLSETNKGKTDMFWTCFATCFAGCRFSVSLWNRMNRHGFAWVDFK